MHLRHLALVLPACVLAVACSSDDKGSAQSAPGTTPADAADRDDESSDPAKGNDRNDTNAGAPCGNACATGTYCDPRDSTCKAGCVRDTDCSGGKRCNVASRSCTSSCSADTDCTQPANGLALCIEGACSASCDSAFHACGNTCRATLDVTACGAACTVCPAVPHGVPTCDGTVCDVECESGYLRAGSACVPSCTTTGCTAPLACDPVDGQCKQESPEPNGSCTRHNQCNGTQFCRASTQTCIDTTSPGSPCTAGYSESFCEFPFGMSCVYSTLPAGTSLRTEECPFGTTDRGAAVCLTGTFRVCIPNN